MGWLKCSGIRISYLRHSGHCAVLRFPRRWRVIPSGLITCRLYCHPQGNCRSVLRECIALPITENSLDPCSPESFIYFIPPRLRKNHFCTVRDNQRHTALWTRRLMIVRKAISHLFTASFCSLLIWYPRGRGFPWQQSRDSLTPHTHYLTCVKMLVEQKTTFECVFVRLCFNPLMPIYRMILFFYPIFLFLTFIHLFVVSVPSFFFLFFLIIRSFCLWYFCVADT